MIGERASNIEITQDGKAIQEDKVSRIIIIIWRGDIFDMFSSNLKIIEISRAANGRIRLELA